MTPHFNFSVETLVMSRPVGWALQQGTLIRKLYPIGSELCNCMFLMSFELDAETLACDCFVNKRGQLVQTQKHKSVMFCAASRKSFVQVKLTHTVCIGNKIVIRIRCFKIYLKTNETKETHCRVFVNVDGCMCACMSTVGRQVYSVAVNRQY